MPDRPRDLPGVADMMSYISVVGAPSSDDVAPSTGLQEESLGLQQRALGENTFRSFESFANSLGPATIFESLQVAYGGVVDGTNPQPDELPNTFLDPSSNVFSTVEFSVVNHESVIILVRVLGNDGRLYPRLQDDSDAIQLRLRAEYDNGAETYVSDPIQPGVNTGGQTFVQTEEVALTEGGFEDSIFKPLIFIVPLRSIITFITIESATYGLSLSLRVRRSPGAIDEFGFLAINRTNSAFNMIESKVSRTFGLVLDQVGAWDILISPEAICAQTSSRPASNFSFSGRMYERMPLDVDENFIMGIGSPQVNSDNDIVSFDASSLPAAVRNGVSLFPVSGYPKVWVLRLQPVVREYLMGLRRAAVGSSLQGCYVDLPIYARGARSLAEGTANVRVFAEVGCVFDYNFCDFYWNLGAPLANVPTVIVQNQMQVVFEELVDCGTDATADALGNVTATSFFLVTVRNMPSLDTGNAMLLLKTPTPPPHLVRVYKPSAQVASRLKRMPTGSSTPAWEFTCPALTALEITTLNKIKLYTGGSLASPIVDPVEIARRSMSESSILVVQPRFNFPPGDEISPDSPTERVVASLGLTFKNWRNNDNRLFSETMLLAAEFQYPTSAVVDLRIPLQAKFYYNEDPEGHLTIRIQQAIWWHAAAYSPSASDAAFDPTASSGGMSSLRLDGAAPVGVDPRYFTSASAGVLAGKFCDTLRSFSLSVIDQNLDSQPDTVVDHPTLGVRMGDPTLLDARVVFNPTAAEAQAIFGSPKLVVKLEDFVTARVPLSYMLMAVYNSGLSLQCADRNIPDDWFGHDTIPGALVDPVSAAELQTAMEPKPQRTSDGLDAGFFVQFAAQQDVRQLGCCGVVVGGGSSSSSSGGGVVTGQCVGGPTLRSWTDTPSRTRIWAVRSGLRGLVSPSVAPSWACFGPTPQELVYAEFDDDTKLDTSIDTAVVTWHHAGFIVLEDNHGLMFPTDFSGTSVDDSFNLGNAYDYQRQLPVDITDIAWDDRGWLWGLCTGPSRTEGNTATSPETSVDGLYRILPGGWSYQRADTISFGGHFAGESEVTARLVESKMGGFSKVACGDGYTLYLTVDGRVEFVSSLSSPPSVPPADVFSATGVVDIAASSTHAACILSDGTLRVWSMGGSGTYITDADGQTNMTKVACGDGLTCTVGTDGNIHAFGVAFSPPVADNPISPFLSVDCGSSHIAGLTEDARLIVSGSYSDATDAAASVSGISVFACGDDCTLYVDAATPSNITYLGPAGSVLSNPPIAFNMDVVAIAAADIHAVALAKSAGCVTCSASALPWGSVATTETGMSLTRDQLPLSFDGQQDKFVSVSCGRRHTCLVTDGTFVEPRYAPARLIYRSKVSLAPGVQVPDEPAAVMVASSDTGVPLPSVSAYDDSTVILGDSTAYSGNPFDFSERVGLKIYDQEARTVRVLSANWRPHRLRADVSDVHQLSSCSGAELPSQSHLVLPPTSDLTLIDNRVDDPSLLTVMQLPESTGGVNTAFDWKSDAASYSTRIYLNSGSSAAIPQSRPDIVSGTASGVVLGVSSFTLGGYSAASAVMPQYFVPGSDLLSTMGAQLFMRSDGVVTDLGSAAPDWSQVPSICAYRAAFEESNLSVGYGSCSVGREFLLRADGDATLGELRSLASSWRLRAAVPKATISSSSSTLVAPFTVEDAGVDDSVVDMDYRFDEASVSASGLSDYSFALGTRSVCLVAPNLYPLATSTCNPLLQWKFDGVTVPCFVSNSLANNAFISSVFSNSNGISSAEGQHTRTPHAPTNFPYYSSRRVSGCDLVDSRDTASGTVCAAVGLGITRLTTTSPTYEQHFCLIETRWSESSNGIISASSVTASARDVRFPFGGSGAPTSYTVEIGFGIHPPVGLIASQAGAFILRGYATNVINDPFGVGGGTEILYLPKDPEASISTSASQPRVLADSLWEYVATGYNVHNILLADGGSDGIPFIGMFITAAGGTFRLKWAFGENGRFSGVTSFPNRFANAQEQQVDPNLVDVFGSAAYSRRNDPNSDVVIIAPRAILSKSFSAASFTVTAIGNVDWLASNGNIQLMHTPGGGKLVAARVGNVTVDFYEFILDPQGAPVDVRKIGTHIHGFGQPITVKANGNRLLLQFSPSAQGDPRHLVLEISEVVSGAVTVLGGEVKAAAVMHAQPAPLRVSVSPDPAQTAAPFIYHDGTGTSSIIYPSPAAGSSGIQDSLPDERLGAFASLPARFHPDEAVGGRYFIENTNKAARVYESSSAGFLCKSRVTDDASLQARAPGALNDLISSGSYRSNMVMPRSAPWGVPYSSIAGVYGRSTSGDQRLVMIGDTVRTMAADGSLSTTGAIRSLPISIPISWITEMNARSANLTIGSGNVTAERPERFGGVLPYRRLKMRYRLDNSITVPFGGGTPISVPPSSTSADVHPWVFWGQWLFRLGVSGSAASVGSPVNVPDSGMTDHLFRTWFHSPTGSGNPAEGYSDYLDGYVTAASSAAGLVVANSRCDYMSRRAATTDPGRMEIRFFSYANGIWSRSQNIVLNDAATMGVDVGVKYHEYSYLPQRISMAISNDGKILAVAGHQWSVNEYGIPQNTQVVIFKRSTSGFVKAGVINASDVVTNDVVGDFARHLEIKDDGAGSYTLNISCPLDPVGGGGTDIGSIAARNRMVSYSLDTNGSAARVAECNDLLPAGEAGFSNSAAANLNHWVASPSPAYNGSQSASWSGQKLTVTTLNRLISLQSDRSNWRITDHVSRPYRYSDAKVLAADFATYRAGFTCPADATACAAVTDIPQLPSPAGGRSSLDGRVRAAFFVPQTVSGLNDSGFYQVDNSGGSDSGWWDGISSDSQIATLPHLSHVSRLNNVQRSTAGGEASWNPSTQGSIRIVPLSGAGAGVPSAIGGSFGCTVRRPLFASKTGVSRLDWPFNGALQVKPKHLVRFVSEAESLRATASNGLDFIDAGTVSLTRDASNIIVLKDCIDRASIAGAAIPTVSPSSWADLSKNAEDLGQLVSLRITSGVAQVRGYTSSGIFPETASPRVSSSSQRFGIKRPMSVTVGGTSACGAGSFDIARPSRSPIAPLEGRAGGRGGSPWLMLVERHGIDSVYFNYGGLDFGARTLSGIDSTILRKADPFMVSPQAPFDPIGHQDRMGWCNSASYPLGGNSTTIAESIIDMLRGALDPDNGSVFNGDRIGLGTTDGYSLSTPPAEYSWAYPDPVGGFGTTVRCLCKSTVFDAYEWVRKTFRLSTSGVGSGETALRVLHGQNVDLDPAAPFYTRFNEDGSPLRSLLFLLTVDSTTGSNSVFSTPMGSTDEATRQGWAQSVFLALRNADIIEANGSIHFIDMVKRDLSDPYRRACETLAEVSGGSYISLGRQPPAAQA